MQADVELHRVQLLSVPVELSRRTREWFAGLVREFDIVATDSGDNVPARLVRFVADVEAEFAQFQGQGEDSLESAAATGSDSVDLDLLLPPRAAEPSLELWAHLVAAIEFCRQGDLLTLEAPPDVTGLLDWYLHEVANQLKGGSPTPWRSG